MADEVPPSSGAGGSDGGRRRRPAPTIDLKATEVASEAPAPAGSAEAAAPTGPHDSAVSGGPATDPAPQSEPSPSGPSEGAPSDDPSARADVAAETDTRRADSAPDGDAGETVSEPRSAPPEERWRILAAGAAGGAGVVIAAILILAIWWDWPYGQDSDGADQRLTAIEARFEDLAKSLPPRPAGSQAIQAGAEALAGLESRLKRLEAEKPVADPAQGQRIDQLDAALRSLSERLAALGERADSSAAALGALKNETRTAIADEGRLLALEKRLGAAESEARTSIEALTAKLTEQAAATDRAVRRAQAASALRAAVQRNEPFQSELAAAASLAEDKAALASLHPFAESGLPSAAALSHALSGLVPDMLQRAGKGSAESGGFLERLQINAQRLVRVRPADEVPGSDPAAVLSRAEARAAEGNLSAAIAELSALPEDVRAPAKNWIARAQARQRALETAREFATGAVAALKPAP